MQLFFSAISFCKSNKNALTDGIADTFDAMTSKRSYRNALPLEVVIEEIEKCSGTQFDPQIATVFLDILKNHYNEIELIQEKYNTTE